MGSTAAEALARLAAIEPLIAAAQALGQRVDSLEYAIRSAADRDPTPRVEALEVSLSASVSRLGAGVQASLDAHEQVHQEVRALRGFFRGEVDTRAQELEQRAAAEMDRQRQGLQHDIDRLRAQMGSYAAQQAQQTPVPGGGGGGVRRQPLHETRCRPERFPRRRLLGNSGDTNFASYVRAPIRIWLLACGWRKTRRPS